MTDYLFLMYDDGQPTGDWPSYFARLGNAFQGGSRIGAGTVERKGGTDQAPIAGLGGYIRIIADDLDHARAFLAGNPVHEGGGTIEIRELPKGE